MDLKRGRGLDVSPEEGFHVLVDALALLLEWPLPTVDATVSSSDRDDYQLIADPAAKTWTVRDDDDNYMSFDPERGLTVVRDGVVERTETPVDAQRHRRPGWVFQGAWFAFPINLPIWGRQADNWKIVSATRDGNVITLGLRPLESEYVGKTEGSLTIDTMRRVVTAFRIRSTDGSSEYYRRLTSIKQPFPPSTMPRETE